MSDEVPPLTLQVGSRWPAYDENHLIRLTLVQRGLAESFPTGDFPRAGATDRTAMGERFSFGCTYFLEAGIEGSCTYGFDLDPGVYEPYPCMRVTNVCLEHNHPHDLSPELWDECKEEEETYLPKGIKAVQEGAFERLLKLRNTLDFRCGDPESLTDYLDSKIREQDFILMSWDLIPDARARTELRRKTERILIRRENYPILPPLPPRGVTFSTSRSAPRPSSSSSPSASTSTRTSQAPAPGLERKAKRAASPSPEPEAKPVCKNPRRKVAPPPTVEKRATSRATGSSTPTVGSPAPQGGQTSNASTPSPVAPVTPVEMIDLRDASDEEVKPEPRAPVVPPTPPAPGSANSSLAQLKRQDPAPVSPATTPAPIRSSKLADFLSSLEPGRHLERYHALFGRSNLEISDPEQLLSFARGPEEELDELVAELGKEVDGLKGMPKMWQGIFRRLLLTAA
ncbi:hypothetical protein C6P46_003274 [Rhodotorula mucilaginosa]|uniref:Uncharacterized protein n=1 Tax=Rhodotorula mucilaginosa TaxID=5537 RepID=A0A9P7B7L9_RHOMI|nr:hypothetical protein C6P46_003274 [Rhodotorula mucilaginosa]